MPNVFDSGVADGNAHATRLKLRGILRYDVADLPAFAGAMTDSADWVLRTASEEIPLGFRLSAALSTCLPKAVLYGGGITALTCLGANGGTELPERMDRCFLTSAFLMRVIGTPVVLWRT